MEEDKKTHHDKVIPFTERKGDQLRTNQYKRHGVWLVSKMIREASGKKNDEEDLQ